MYFMIARGKKAKIRARICCLVLVLFSVCSCNKRLAVLPSFTKQSQARKIVENQGKSVVLVATYDKRGKLLSYGSGFFVSREGEIATNYHVIEGAYSAIARTIDGEEYEDVYLLSYEKDRDIALLKVNGINTPAAKLGDSDSVKQGDKALTIGNPQGLQNTVTDGIISGIRQSEGLKMFQITCPISEGSSGGPLYNLNGEVIGITTLMSKMGQNLNFAVPINYLVLLEKDQAKLSLKEKYLKGRKKLLSDYLEKQEMSSELNPEDALFEDAYEFYEKAKATAKNPNYFYSLGTDDEQGIEYLEEAIEVNPYYHAAYYVLGRSYQEMKEYEKTEEAFLKALELKPKCLPAYLRLADLYKDTRRHDEALKYYDRALAIGPPSAWIYSSMGDIYFEQGDLDEAEKIYIKMLDMTDSASGFLLLDTAYEKLAGLCLKKGDLKSSWNYLKNATPFVTEETAQQRIAPYQQYLKKGDFYAYLSVAHIYYYSLKYKEAIEYFERALRSNPTDFDQFYEIGMAYKNTEDYKNAIEFLEKAVTLNPTHYDAHLELGIVYDVEPVLAEHYKEKYGILPNYARAINLLSVAQETNPNNAAAYYYLGRVYYHDGQYYNALQETEKALDIEEDSYTLDQLGSIYFAMHEYENALDACNRSLVLNDRKWTRWEIGKTLIELKKCDQAITFLKESLQKWNNDFLLNLCLAEAYQCNEDYVDAISRYKKCLRIDPENSSGHFQIAQCYYAQREWDKAEQWYKKSKKLNPKCFASLHNLGLVYVNKGEFSKALKSFKNALKLAPENADTKEMINACQLEIERRRLPEKLEELSGIEGVVGSLARLMLYIEQYAKADDLLIAGRNETKPEYKSGVFIRNKVSPKIYQAQGLFEKIKHDLEKIEVSDAHIQEVVELFLVSADQRVAGIETFSRGYYTWVKDYKGEYEKGEAKIRLADSYFLNGLKKLQVQLKKHKAQFGVAAQDILVHLINYLEKVNEI